MEKIKLKPEDIRVEILNDKNIHRTNDFSSVSNELSAFLKENAWKESQMDFSKTYLFFHSAILAGYVTLLMDKQSLKLNHSHFSLSKFESKTEEGYSSVPALKIGRICVSDDYNSQLESAKYRGLGKIIFVFVLDYARDLRGKVGCRVLTTHAKKENKAYQWYLKLGFTFSHNDEKIKNMLEDEEIFSIPMFYDINRIIGN